ncbi:toll/interleukin-1 receptor domain-containing protein [Clostridium fermenticellae]|uniref:toll/interleukin-1 receptor domain-containing protein n=1 Tax=Clostridium fermenticellae TaxID=2068654 RepID=UPI0018F8878F|nr:toll/interleukin-1 receptor domain-containing protein [Clostridium fermenticellae]
MYKGFNVIDDAIFNKKEYYDTGNGNHENNKNIVEKELDEYVGKDGILDGSKIKNDWFKDIDADIFISHSHDDEDLAIKLAGWLKQEFGLTSFIDSCVWKYSNNLLKEIDNAYCKTDDGAYYNYDSRNFSTSHVHMMLSTALTEMIDRTECIFFLNTPNSIYTKDVIKNETMSPWIYSELVTTRLIRETKPSRIINESVLEKKYYDFAKQANLRIKYDVNLDHLYAINYNGFCNWKKINNGKKSKDILDNLYSLLV